VLVQQLQLLVLHLLQLQRVCLLQVSAALQRSSPRLLRILQLLREWRAHLTVVGIHCRLQVGCRGLLLQQLLNRVLQLALELRELFQQHLLTVVMRLVRQGAHVCHMWC
jgi:hypothetical protein